MRCRPQIVALMLSVSALIASTQSIPKSESSKRGTQIRGFWVDPSNGLIWAGKDNGKDVSWKGAMKYCRDLRLAGYSDWRLANMAVLQGVFDSSANAPGQAGPRKKPGISLFM